MPIPAESPNDCFALEQLECLTKSGLVVLRDVQSRPRCERIGLQLNVSTVAPPNLFQATSARQGRIVELVINNSYPSIQIHRNRRFTGQCSQQCGAAVFALWLQPKVENVVQFIEIL